MAKTRQSGAINALLLPLVVVVLLLIGAVVFGMLTYGKEKDYKDNSDQKSAVAVSAALKVEDAKKDAAFAEASKDPLKTYIGPSDFGSLHVSYPKTWSAYVDEGTSGNTDVDGYFYPDFVPSVTDTTNSFALRVQILNQSYSTVLQQLSGAVQSGTLTITPYSLPMMKSIVGSRADGAIAQGKTGSMVILPLRDKTVQIWTEASQFLNDFNTNILPNVSFSP